MDDTFLTASSMSPSPIHKIEDSYLIGQGDELTMKDLFAPSVSPNPLYDFDQNSDWDLSCSSNYLSDSDGAQIDLHSTLGRQDLASYCQDQDNVDSLTDLGGFAEYSSVQSQSILLNDGAYYVGNSTVETNDVNLSPSYQRSLDYTAEEEVHSCPFVFSDHDYASTSPSQIHEVNDEPLIEVNQNRKGGHYRDDSDAITVRSFSPQKKTARGSRVPFKTVRKILTSEEIYIFARYRSAEKQSQDPRDEHADSMLRNIQIKEEEMVDSALKCNCFLDHPSFAFCVISDKATISWSVMAGVSVAKLKVKEETEVDMSIGFWSMKNLTGHGLCRKGVFNQLVFQIINTSVKQQSFFYKTCASPARDLNGFLLELKKVFPERPRFRSSFTYTETSGRILSERTGRNKKFKTEKVYEEQVPLRVTLPKDCLKKFEEAFKSEKCWKLSGVESGPTL